MVGPAAWTCSDDAELSPADALPAPRRVGTDGLEAQYFFVGKDGTSAYASFETAEEGTPDRELESGWAVAVLEQRTRNGEAWGRTSKGLWIALRDLVAAHPSTFRGEPVADGRLDVAWVLADRANVWSVPSAKGKPRDARARFQVVHVKDESAPMVRSDDGAWMLSRDLARPSVAPKPNEVTRPGERWIDVDLASQTLVAYEGDRPVYATLVSTGRAESPTPIGLHRIWVKMLVSDMGNLDNAADAERYSLQDVPYIQFFDQAVALHGTYWHRDFGHVRSHGCVNLAPLDARWLFDFTSPRVLAGWAAVYPTAFDPGTLVRVR
jgi:lipoprotein-anchoring transpeptidase ErfK/SrfK